MVRRHPPAGRNNPQRCSVQANPKACYPDGYPVTARLMIVSTAPAYPLGHSLWDRPRPSTARQGRAQCRDSGPTGPGNNHSPAETPRAAAGALLIPIEDNSAKHAA